MTHLTGIILAGGRSRRLGRDKAVQSVGGVRIIDRVITRLSGVAESLTVVVDREERVGELEINEKVDFIVDRYPDSGSLGGLYSGLQASTTTWSLVVACDMPFISDSLVQYMRSKLETGTPDVVIPNFQGRLQTTHALYRNTCLGHIEERLKQRSLRMDGYFSDVEICTLQEEDFLSIEGSKESFFNVNTPTDLQMAQDMEKNVSRD